MLNGSQKFARFEVTRFTSRTEASTAILNALLEIPDVDRRRLILTAVAIAQALSSFHPDERAEIMRTVTSGARL